MHVLHFDSDDIENPLRGGQPVRTYEVNRRIATCNDVTVLTATYPKSSRRASRAGVRYRRLGVTIPGFGLSSHFSFLASAGLAVRCIPHDIVVEEFAPPIGFCFLPWFTKRPVVSIVQWFYFSDWQKRYGLPFEAMMRGARSIVPYRDIIVQTNTMEKYFSELLPRARVWKIGCGVENELFDLQAYPGDYALYVGRLDTNHKGLDLLMSAWAANKAGGIEIPLMIVGEGPGRGDLERQIAAHGLEDQVRLLGRLEGDAKRSVIRNCAFLVMPSRQETFGLVALEAMAASKPVVAFDIANLNEVLSPDWSFLVRPFDVREFARASAILWTDPDRRRTLGARAVRAAQTARWDVVAQKQVGVYRAVLAGRHAA